MASGENIVDINVTVPQSNHSINVFVPGSTGEVTARDNLAETYAEWARLWAIKMGDKVNGEDYSSKYYAQQARYSSEQAKISENNCIATANTLQTNYNYYIEELSNLINTSLNDIETAREEALEEITEAGGGVNVNEFNTLKNDVSDLTVTVNNKQDILTPGENISIDENVISSDVDMQPYNLNKNYPAERWVTVVTNKGKKIFQSKQDNNQGHAVTDTDWWEEVKFGSSGSGGGELLDIGFTLTGIDESENKRRYLNGQVVIQDQFPDGVKKLKKLVGWEKTKDNFTKQGSVVVSASGVASNFSVDNFILLPDVFNPGNNPWKFRTNVTTAAVITENHQNIITRNSAEHKGINIDISPEGKLSLFLGSDGINWDIASADTAAEALNSNTNYDILLEFTGTNYIASIKESSQEVWNPVINIESSKVIAPYRQEIGKYISGDPFLGTVDLSKTFFEIAGNTRWEYKTGQATLLPNLVTTESNWQAEKTASVFGQVGKFVIDDEAGTIRLPLIKTLQGVYDLAKAGLRVPQKLPNVTGRSESLYLTNQGAQCHGCVTALQTDKSRYGNTLSDANYTYGIGVDLSKGNSTYQNGAPVQMEVLQFPLYIQLATGVEETERPINEYVAAVPYSYGVSQYSTQAMDNACWLKSAGQWNSTGVYTGLATWIQEKVAAGEKNFKTPKGYAYSNSSIGWTWWIATPTPVVGMSVYRWINSYGIEFYILDGKITAVNTDGSITIASNSKGNVTATRNASQDVTSEAWIGDYDWVFDSENGRFKLPLKDGSESLKGTKYVRWNIPTTATSNGNSDINVICPVNATIAIDANVTSNSGFVILSSGNLRAFGYPQNGTDSTVAIYNVIPGAGVTLTYNGTYTIKEWQRGLYYIPNVGAGDLYYYIGAVEENPGLVNIARIQEEIVDTKAEKLDKSAVKSYVTQTYRNGTSWYRVYSDGFCEQGFTFPFTGGEGKENTVSLLKAYNNNQYTTIFNPNSSNHFVSINQSNASFSFRVYERSVNGNVSGTAIVYVVGYIN